MWSEALRLLERADRLHRQFFLNPEPASWQPPLDVVERGAELRLQLALPGVPGDAVSVLRDASGITVSAVRGFPGCEREAEIHRLEIPYGRFERHIAFPVHRYEFVSKKLLDGLLTLTFRRKEGT
jgi:HSP20 family protein